MTDAYAFDGLPLAEIPSGATVLLCGPTHGGTRALGLRMLAGDPGEGAIVVTTNRRAKRIADDCRRVGIELATDDTAIVDCVGDDAADIPARVLTVSGPSDLTGIGMRFSDVSRAFRLGGIDRVRTGICSLSTLLTFSDLRTTSRFVHTLVGRIDAIDGLGVLVVDPANHDERSISTFSQFCTGRVDVRDEGDRPELRVRGFPDQSRDWQPFDPTPE